MDVLTLGGMLAVMLYLDWRFTLLGLAVAPLLFAVVYRRTHRIRQAAREVKQREGAVASIVQESISAIRTVRAFAREAHEEARLEREGRAAMEAALRARSIKAALPPIVDLLVAAGTCVVMLVGVRLVLAGRITSGTLIVFVLYLGKLYKPMKNLARMTDTVSKSTVAFERIRELLATASPVTERARRPPGPTPSRPHRVARRPVRLRAGPAGPERRQPHGRCRPARGDRRRDRRRQIDAAGPAPPPVRTGERLDPDRRHRHPPLHSPVAARSDQPGAAGPVLFHGPVWENIAYGRPGASRDEIVRPRASPTRTSSSCACRTATTRSSASAAKPCRGASGSGSRSRAPSSGRRRSCCSTSRRRRSTPNPKRSSSTRCRG